MELKRNFTLFSVEIYSCLFCFFVCRRITEAAGYKDHKIQVASCLISLKVEPLPALLVNHSGTPLIKIVLTHVLVRATQCKLPNPPNSTHILMIRLHFLQRRNTGKCFLFHCWMYLLVVRHFIRCFMVWLLQQELDALAWNLSALFLALSYVRRWVSTTYWGLWNWACPVKRANPVLFFYGFLLSLLAFFPLTEHVASRNQTDYRYLNCKLGAL